MPEVLINDLKMFKNKVKKINGFNENYFVDGDAFPVSPNALSYHKNTNCELAVGHEIDYTTLDIRYITIN